MLCRGKKREINDKYLRKHKEKDENQYLNSLFSVTLWETENSFYAEIDIT